MEIGSKAGRKHFKVKYDYVINFPKQYSFFESGVVKIDAILAPLNWSIKSATVLLDFSKCTVASYQALTLVILYMWHLKSTKCSVHVKFAHGYVGVRKMWNMLGAEKWLDVLIGKSETFSSYEVKLLHSIRNYDSIKLTLEKASKYIDQFDVGYKNLMNYIIFEVLSNSLDHGWNRYSYKGAIKSIPGLISLNWLAKRDELHFIIADVGIGILEHLRNFIPALPNDTEAIKAAVQPKISGTFSSSGNYAAKNNAGMGLYYSSNIAKRLNADMYIISGKGVMHISPMDITTSELVNRWNGTFIFVRVRLSRSDAVNYEKMMGEIRESARKEVEERDKEEGKGSYYINLENYFGRHLNNKDDAIKFRERRLIREVSLGKTIIIDFNNIEFAPHSFLNALLSDPIRIMGIEAYKRIKIINYTVEYRGTIDYILDQNT